MNLSPAQRSRELHETCDYIIRPAREDDCQDIMRLIQELAEYEKLAHQVQIDAEALRQNGFGEDPKFYCHVAERTTSDGSGDGGGLIGYSLYHFSFSPWAGSFCFLEDLFVTPDWRGKGVGTALMAHAVKTALDKGCSRFEWTALGWNKPAMEFYKRCGGVNLTEAEDKNLFRMTRPVMEQFASQSRF